jgi:hypothetical protein
MEKAQEDLGLTSIPLSIIPEQPGEFNGTTKSSTNGNTIKIFLGFYFKTNRTIPNTGRPL